MSCDWKKKKKRCVLVVFCKKGKLRFCKVCGKKARKVADLCDDEWDDEDDDD